MGEYVNLNQANNNIDLDKRIKFKCSQCGKCCYQRNINAVEYNPYDIYRLSKFLGLSIPEFIDKYGVLDKDEMNFPVIKLRTKQYRGQCLFLKKGKCTVHEVKPLACALFPLGRGFNIIEDKYMYVWQGCPRASDDGQITPREWLERFGIKEDEIGKSWLKQKTILVDYLWRLPFQLPEGIYTKIVEWLYYKYDTNKHFLPQFEHNCQELNIYMNEHSRLVQQAQELGILIK